MRVEFPSTEQPRAHWISAKLRFAILIEGAGLLGFEDRVYLFQHPDLDTALNQAAEIGKNHNHEYVNAEGQKVRWQLADILNLQLIFLDGNPSGELEVYSERVDVPDGTVPFDWKPSDKWTSSGLSARSSDWI